MFYIIRHSYAQSSSLDDCSKTIFELCNFSLFFILILLHFLCQSELFFISLFYLIRLHNLFFCLRIAFLRYSNLQPIGKFHSVESIFDFYIYQVLDQILWFNWFPSEDILAFLNEFLGIHSHDLVEPPFHNIFFEQIVQRKLYHTMYNHSVLLIFLYYFRGNLEYTW